jgi:hypothetical protein
MCGASCASICGSSAIDGGFCFFAQGILFQKEALFFFEKKNQETFMISVFELFKIGIGPTV